jgi:hypothetical protein
MKAIRIIWQYAWMCPYQFICALHSIMAVPAAQIVQESITLTLHALWDWPKKNSVSLSPQAKYTEWATATCWRNLVLNFADRGISRSQRCGSLTIVNFNFLDQRNWSLCSKFLVYVKVQVKLPLCLTNRALGHEGVWGKGGYIHGSSWRWAISFTPLRLYLRYAIDSRLGGTQDSSRLHVEDTSDDPVQPVASLYIH